MEKWDLYDKERVKTGETMVRGDTFPENTYHIVVHVCIFNKQGEMLIQQRQPFKKGWSNMWDVTVGGSAVAGETSARAAEREVAEEIGYTIDLTNVRPLFTVNIEVGFDEYYVLEEPLDIADLELQYEEVQRVMWASLDEITRLMDEGKFIPYYRSLIQMLFEMRGREMGSHQK